VVQTDAGAGLHYERDLAHQPDTECENWIWSPMGVVDMSMPERWGVLQFADDRVGQTDKVALPFWRARAVAMAVHNAQQAFDEGISSFYPPILVYMENPYRNTK
jgi:hypothetical protein